MKGLRVLLMVGSAASNLLIAGLGMAGEPGPPPKVVAQDPNDASLQRELKGVPENVKILVLNFAKTRDKFLLQQESLQIRKGKAATPEERERLRAQLQANRQEFLDELKSYQDQLREDLQQLKSKMSHAEFLRVIDAAHGATSGSRHKGHS
jgi:hypothetical protein